MAKAAAKKKTTKAVAVREPRAPKIAYTVKDPVFGEFAVRHSANAWWMEPTKLELAIHAFKCRASLRKASIAAGCSEQQMYYFIDQHPEFSSVIERCREVVGLNALYGMADLIEKKDGTTIRWFLESTEPNEYGKKPPVVAVQVNMANKVAEDRSAYQ